MACTAPNYEGPTEAITKRLEELLNQEIANPQPLLSMLEFKRLPYGKVTFEALTALCEQTMESDPKAPFLLFYATEQELYFQKQLEKLICALTYLYTML